MIYSAIRPGGHGRTQDEDDDLDTSDGAPSTSYTFYVQDNICKTKKRQQAQALKRPAVAKPRKPIDSYGFPCPGLPWLLGRLMTYRHAMVYINTFNVYDKRTRGNGYTPTQFNMHGMRTSATKIAAAFSPGVYILLQDL